MADRLCGVPENPRRFLKLAEECVAKNGVGAQYLNALMAQGTPVLGEDEPEACVRNLRDNPACRQLHQIESELHA